MNSEFELIEKEICIQEEKVQAEIKKLNELHRSRKPQLIEDYTFKGLLGNVSLSSLFKGRDELIVIHNMGKKCSYCTLWADGFNGYYSQIESRASFVVINNDLPSEQYAFGTSRNWKFPMASAFETSFAKDMGFYSEEEKMLWPGVSMFKKESDGKIFRTTKAGFGPGDLFSSIWHLFELLPKGVNDWQPKIESQKKKNAGILDVDGFNVAVAYVHEMQSAMNFYCDLLGFEKTRDMAPGVLLHQPNADLTLYLEANKEKNEAQKKAQLSLCFNSALGVLKSVEVLKSKEIKIVSQYGSSEEGFAGVQFLDPSGNLIEIAGNP